MEQKPRNLTPHELAGIVRVFRDARGWSQEQLAEISRLSARTVQRVEEGAPSSADTRRALAAAFGFEDIDAFNKPYVIPTAEEVAAAKVRFDKEHVTLKAERVESGKQLATLAAGASACPRAPRTTSRAPPCAAGVPASPCKCGWQRTFRTITSAAADAAGSHRVPCSRRRPSCRRARSKWWQARKGSRSSTLLQRCIGMLAPRAVSTCSDVPTIRTITFTESTSCIRNWPRDTARPNRSSPGSSLPWSRTAPRPPMMHGVRAQLREAGIPAYDAFSPEIMDVIAWHQVKLRAS